MNTKTLRIILGVLCIVAFLVAVFTPLADIGRVDLSLCELISLNKAGLTGGASGVISGVAEGDRMILDGVTVTVILGFVASMLALLTSYLALITSIDKRFAGFSGLTASIAGAACVIFLIVYSGRINALLPAARLASIGWGAIALTGLCMLVTVASILLLAIKDRRKARGAAVKHAAPVEPTHKDPVRHAASTYRESGPVPGYARAGAAADHGSVTAPKPAQEPARRFSPVYITGLEGAYKGARLDVSDGSTVNFGRDASVCQVVFDKYDTLISRRHLSIRYVPQYNMFEAMDMSRNGTFVDGLSKKLPAFEAQLLSRGTVLLIGSEKEAFRLD